MMVIMVMVIMVVMVVMLVMVVIVVMAVMVVMVVIFQPILNISQQNATLVLMIKTKGSQKNCPCLDRVSGSQRAHCFGKHFFRLPEQ